MGGPVTNGATGALRRVAAVACAVLVIAGIIGTMSFAPTELPATLSTTTPTRPTTYPRITAHGIELGNGEAILIGHDWRDYESITWIRSEPLCRVGVTQSGITVGAANNSVVVVSVRDSGIATPEGVEVGMSMAEVHAIYGPSKEDSGRLVLPDGDDEMVVEFHDERVSYLWARRSGVDVQC